VNGETDRRLVIAFDLPARTSRELGRTTARLLTLLVSLSAAPCQGASQGARDPAIGKWRLQDENPFSGTLIDLDAETLVVRENGSTARPRLRLACEQAGELIATVPRTWVLADGVVVAQEEQGIIEALRYAGDARAGGEGHDGRRRHGSHPLRSRTERCGAGRARGPLRPAPAHHEPGATASRPSGASAKDALSRGRSHLAITHRLQRSS
jgi:hypothetical protein